MPAAEASPEHPILRARSEGRLSADGAFEQLYRAYGRTVRAWLALRLPPRDVEDAAQDVWCIFYRRWRGWRFLPEMERREARPVLSFLFRTAHFVLRGRRRAARRHQVADDLDIEDGHRGPEALTRKLEIGRVLALACRICPPQELDVLAARLSGVPAREAARALSISEAAVDHRYRNAVARLKRRLVPDRRPKRGPNDV